MQGQFGHLGDFGLAFDFTTHRLAYSGKINLRFAEKDGSLNEELHAGAYSVSKLHLSVMKMSRQGCMVSSMVYWQS